MKKLLYLSLLLASFCYGQSTACNIDNTTLPFTGVATGANYNNNTLTRYCNTWTLQVWSTGFSAISCQLESANDNSGTPGSFSILTATPAVGTNPITTLSGVLQVQSFSPWMRVNCTTATGTGKITYRLNGANGITAKIPGGTGSGVTFSAPYVTASANVFGPAWVLVQPPLTGWTFDNQGASTNTTTNGYDYGHFAPSAGAAALRMLYRAAPATPYSIAALFSSSPAPATAGAENMMAFGFRDGGGKWVTIMIGTSSSNIAILVSHWNSATSFGANVYTLSGGPLLAALSLNQGLFLKIVDDGTNITFNTSIDGGNDWQLLYTELRGSFLTTGPVSVGFGGYINSTTVDTALFSWKQGVS